MNHLFEQKAEELRPCHFPLELLHRFPFALNLSQHYSPVRVSNSLFLQFTFNNFNKNDLYFHLFGSAIK